MTAYKGFAGDALAWGGNVSSAVAIVFVNKLLMDPRHGYGFTFGEGSQRASRAFYVT